MKMKFKQYFVYLYCYKANICINSFKINKWNRTVYTALLLCYKFVGLFKFKT